MDNKLYKVHDAYIKITKNWYRDFTKACFISFCIVTKLVV